MHYNSIVTNLVKLPIGAIKANLRKKPGNSNKEDNNNSSRMSSIVEPVQDLYVEHTTADPGIFNKCKRENMIIERMALKEVKDKIEQENKRELKRISNERAEITRDLRKLLIDKHVVQRSDATDFGTLRQRRKSREFEDINLPSASKRGEFSHLTAFVSYGKAKMPIVKKDILKRASSDQRLNTVNDLKIYQHWEGEPGAIGSVRREQKSREMQLEELNYARSRRYDTKNDPKRSSKPPSPVTSSRPGSVKTGTRPTTSISGAKAMPIVLKPLLASATSMVESGSKPGSSKKPLSASKKISPETFSSKKNKKTKKEDRGRKSSLGKNRVDPI